MTKQKITALALIALGLTGIVLAFTCAILKLKLPAEHAQHMSDDLLTHLFMVSFFGGLVLLCIAACILDDIRFENQRQAPFRDMKQEIRDYRKKRARR